MNRRGVIGLVGGAAAAWPVGARAQQGERIRRIGILNYAAEKDRRVDDFRNALRELGYVERQNLALIYRWADGHMERLPMLAAELLNSNVEVIIAIGPAVWAAKRATTSVPIVIAFSGDPVGNGVVRNLARPGGNITGFSYMSTDLAAKRLELLTQIFPRSSRTGILYSRDEPATELEMRETKAAARILGVTLQPIPADTATELDPAFLTGIAEGAGALIVFTHGFAVLNGGRIIEQAARHRLPTMYGWRDFVEEGGLMSYGPDIPLMVKKAAGYVDRILKGQNPGDLPVEQPARLEFVVNLKTARVLGIEIPPTVLARADEVLE